MCIYYPKTLSLTFQYKGIEFECSFVSPRNIYCAKKEELEGKGGAKLLGNVTDY